MNLLSPCRNGMIFGILIFLLPSLCAAQAPRGPEKTVLEIELMAPTRLSDPLIAQRWRRIFEELNEGVRVRQPLPGDEPKVEELARGTFRLVRIWGEIGSDGSVTFPGKRFQINQVDKLREYLGELKAYGAQGSPAGKPLWGLSKEQFTKVYDLVRAPIEKPLKGMELEAALKQLPLPFTHQLKFQTTAGEIWEREKKQVLQSEVQGLSTGTAMAYLLSQAGLGFRPMRTPSGEIDLVADILVDAKDSWPVGWPPPEGKSRDQYIPKMFTKIETSIQESPLRTVLEAIDTQSGVRILVDWKTCASKQIDLDSILVSYPEKKTAWALVVNHVIANSFLTLRYALDEREAGFIAISPVSYYQPRKPAIQENKTSKGRSGE